MPEFKSTRTPEADKKANEEARIKLTGLLSKKENEVLGLVGIEDRINKMPNDLAEIQDAVFVKNLDFLRTLQTTLNEWEEKFINAKDLPKEQAEVIYKILIKEIFIKGRDSNSSVQTIDRYGGDPEKNELRKLNSRIDILKKKIVEILNKL